MLRNILGRLATWFSEDAETRSMSAELAAKMGKYANFVFALAVLLPCGDLSKVADELTNVYQTGRLDSIALFWGGLGVLILLAGIVWLMYIRTSVIAKRRPERFNAVASSASIAILHGDIAWFTLPIVPYANPVYREINATGFLFLRGLCGDADDRGVEREAQRD